MSRTDNLVRLAIHRLTKSLSDVYERELGDKVSQAFHEELDKLDYGLTRRLSRRPITREEIQKVMKAAKGQLDGMITREKKRCQTIETN